MTNAGNTPTWNEILTFTVHDYNHLADIKVMDADTFKDDSLGTTQAKISDLLAVNTEINLPLAQKGQEAGSLFVMSSYTPPHQAYENDRTSGWVDSGKFELVLSGNQSS